MEDASGEEVISGSPEVLGQPVELIVDGPKEIGDDIAASDARGDLPPRPYVDSHEHSLRDERVGEGVPEGVPTDIAGRLQERYEHVRPDESEDCIREDTGSGRRAIGRVAPEPTPGYLPVQTMTAFPAVPPSARSRRWAERFRFQRAYVKWYSSTSQTGRYPILI